MNSVRRVTLVTLAFFTLPVWPQQQPQQQQRLFTQSEAIRVRNRVALVIGNADYKGAPLKNPVNDARSIAAALRELGFEVREGLNLTRRQMGQAIDQFTRQLQRDDFGLFYFAGHGVQVDQENFLVPIDFTADVDTDVQYESYSASQVRDKMEKSGARLRVLVLDACRNNPFRPRNRALGGGLAVMQSNAEGTLIAFATGDNNVASDNPAETNGLFTKHLIPALRTRDLALDEMFKRAKEEVHRESKGKQLPFTYDGIVGRFYFGQPPAVSGATPGGAPVVTAAPAPLASIEPVRPTGPSADTALQVELAYWNSIDRNDPESLRQYLSRYPEGRFAEIARRTMSGPRPASVQPQGPAQPQSPVLEAAPAAPTQSRAHAILQRALVAAGGSRLLALRDYELEFGANLITPNGPVALRISVTRSVSGLDLTRIQTQAGQSVSGYDGERAWFSDATGFRWGNEKENAEAKAEGIRDQVFILREFQKPGWILQILPSTPVQQPSGPVLCDVVSVTHSASGTQNTLFIDPSSGLILGTARTGEFLGQWGIITEIAWDYRTVQGIPFAFQGAVAVNGIRVVEASLANVRVNPNIPLSRYRAPQR